MGDELEPGPDPRMTRNPMSRRPGPPRLLDAVLQSYNEGQSFSIRKPTKAEAKKVKAEITAAVYYLNKWKSYDVRVNPYITQHYKIDGVEYSLSAKTAKTEGTWCIRGSRESWSLDEFRTLVLAASQCGAQVEHYWKANFWVHDPLNRGFRQTSKDQGETARKRSAQARGVEIKLPQGRRRTVQVRANG